MAGVDTHGDRAVLGDGHFQSVDATGCDVDVILEKIFVRKMSVLLIII
jgi:hypothetical protein